MSLTQDQRLMFCPMLIVRDAQSRNPFDWARVVVARDLQHQYSRPRCCTSRNVARKKASNIVVISNNVAPAGTRGS